MQRATHLRRQPTRCSGCVESPGTSQRCDTRSTPTLPCPCMYPHQLAVRGSAAISLDAHPFQPLLRIYRQLIGRSPSVLRLRVPVAQQLIYGPPQQHTIGSGCVAVSGVVTESPSAETWDDNRIKPLYEQLLNQFHAADLDGSVGLADRLMHTLCNAHKRLSSHDSHQSAVITCRNGVIDSRELRALLETFEDGGDRSTTHWLTGNSLALH